MAISRLARRIMRAGLTAALATLEADTGDPNVSLIAVALDMAGRPVLLASDLARHTKNFRHDARSAVLFDETAGRAAPLEGGRVSVKGRLEALGDDAVKARYLRQHEDALEFADFGDFGFYRLVPEQAYLVGGFGRIQTLGADDILLSGEIVDRLADAEPDILDHMNQDHGPAVKLYAGLAGGDPADDWRMVSIDPEGLNIRYAGQLLRLDFEQPLTAVAEARTRLAALAELARGREG
jgi:putative heme iron utilization protein